MLVRLHKQHTVDYHNCRLNKLDDCYRSGLDLVQAMLPHVASFTNLVHRGRAQANFARRLYLRSRRN